MSNKSNTISQDQVEYLAKNLCKLTLTPQEVLKFSEVLTDTLDYINVLNELDVSKVFETHQVTGTKNVFNTVDTSKATLSQQQALQNAKKTKDGMFEIDIVLANKDDD